MMPEDKRLNPFLFKQVHYSNNLILLVLGRMMNKLKGFIRKLLILMVFFLRE